MTPSSSTVTWSPAATVLPEAIVHTSTVCELTPQVPTWAPASVTTVLTIVVVFEPVGKVIVMCCPSPNAPVADVLKWIT